MSALSSRGLSQTDAGRALEVWRQTLLEPLTGVEVPDDRWLMKFHGGQVDILQQPPPDYRWPADFGCAVWATSVEESDLKIGSDETPIAIQTAFYFRESERTRDPVETSLEDLAWYYRAAALSQHSLVWKGTWDADPPAGSTIKSAGAGMAIRRERIFPADFGRFYDPEDDCEGVEALFVTAWIQRIMLC